MRKEGEGGQSTETNTQTCNHSVMLAPAPKGGEAVLLPIAAAGGATGGGGGPRQAEVRMEGRGNDGTGVDERGVEKADTEADVAEKPEAKERSDDPFMYPIATSVSFQLVGKGRESRSGEKEEEKERET